MKRKYFSALLMGALTIASVSTFTSCKDYDDDISSLQSQIDKLNEMVSKIQGQIDNGAILTDVTNVENGVKITLKRMVIQKSTLSPMVPMVLTTFGQSAMMAIGT